jgi:hypothetical protein
MREIDRAEFKARVREILACHVGPDECVSMYRLYQVITGHPIIPMRKVNQTRLIRSVIAELQEDGEPIVHKSGQEGGYYTAETKAELEQEAAWFRKRALSAFRREKMLRRISDEELLRQYALELNVGRVSEA